MGHVDPDAAQRAEIEENTDRKYNLSPSADEHGIPPHYYFLLTQEGETAQAFWQLLYQYRADLVLNGHDHLYARYRPLDPSGNYDPRKGIREFIVGTGGETLDTVVKTNTTTADPTGNPNFNAENLESATGNYWGVMALTLEQNGYEWDFEPALELPGAAAAPYSDTGFGSCHGGR
ncbi:MAG: hypothetical protein WBQ31_12700 [Candidatus Acidiferrales bacterium]